MKLRYVSECLSIKPFNEISLPDFTLLTGLNGAGKSQLILALLHGHVAIDNILKDNIVVFQSSLFGLDNEMPVKLLDLQTEKSNVFLAMRQELGNRKGNPLIIQNWKDICEIASKSNTSFYDLLEGDFKDLPDRNVFIHYRDYASNIKYFLEDLNHSIGGVIIAKPIILRICKKIKKPLEDLSREEFDDLYAPISYKNNFLINSLTKVFSDYWEKWELNSYRTFLNEKDKKNYPVLSEVEFRNKYGEKPWETINSIIETFGSLQYHINSPEGIERGFEYTLKLISNDNPVVEIQFDALSSGERIMMGLVATLYKSKVDTNFPEILLLDEIDSSLHPSMAQGLLKVIQKDLVTQKKLKVILVSHSPSTVALAPEDSIYIMNRVGLNRLIKSSKKEALNILTEGFASLTEAESNLQVSYNIRKASKYVLLTEGITDRIILEGAWKALESTESHFDIQDCFDASFLRNLFARGDIFINYPDKTFIALFDFDTEGYNAWNGLSQFELIESDPKKGLLKKHKTASAYALLLPVPNNEIKFQVIKSGLETFKDQSHMPIELLFYDVHAFKFNFIKEPQAGGGNLIKFNGGKVAFAERVSKLLNAADFQVLKPIFETLKSVFKK